MTFFQRVISTKAPGAVILIRLMVGTVFLSEGIQKFLFPAEVGTGRFAKIGIPRPDMMAPFVGVVEVACGTLVLLGLLTRLAVIPLIVVMLVAILSTKIPIFLGEGFWGMAHEARTDWSRYSVQFFCSLSEQAHYPSTGAFRPGKQNVSWLKRMLMANSRCHEGKGEIL